LWTWEAPEACRAAIRDRILTANGNVVEMMPQEQALSWIAAFLSR
jgi:hypothetical protein